LNQQAKAWLVWWTMQGRPRSIPRTRMATIPPEAFTENEDQFLATWRDPRGGYHRLIVNYCPQNDRGIVTHEGVNRSGPLHIARDVCWPGVRAAIQSLLTQGMTR